jgi:hypothetical protein
MDDAALAMRQPNERLLMPPSHCLRDLGRLAAAAGIWLTNPASRASQPELVVQRRRDPAGADCIDADATPDQFIRQCTLRSRPQTAGNMASVDRRTRLPLHY